MAEKPTEAAQRPAARPKMSFPPEEWVVVWLKVSRTSLKASAGTTRAR